MLKKQCYRNKIKRNVSKTMKKKKKKKKSVF